MWRETMKTIVHKSHLTQFCCYYRHKNTSHSVEKQSFQSLSKPPAQLLPLRAIHRFSGKSNSKSQRAYEGMDEGRLDWKVKKKNERESEREREQTWLEDVWRFLYCRINSSLFICSAPPPPLPPVAPGVDKAPQHPTPTQEKHNTDYPEPIWFPSLYPLTSHPPTLSHSLLADVSCPIFPLQPSFHDILSEFIHLPRLSYCCHTRLLSVLSFICNAVFSSPLMSHLSLFLSHFSFSSFCTTTIALFLSATPIINDLVFLLLSSLSSLSLYQTVW